MLPVRLLSSQRGEHTPHSLPLLQAPPTLHPDPDPSTASVAVSFGDAAAANVVVVGSRWIRGEIPSNPAGKCPEDVFVTYGATTLRMPAVFCYLDQ